MKTSRAHKPGVAATRRTRQRHRCAMCWWRHADVYVDTVRQDRQLSASAPATTWGLCHACYEAVQREMTRAGLRSADRLLVAIGIVAAERIPTRYLRALSTSMRRPLSYVEADMLFFLTIMFVTISGLIIGLTALAFLTTQLF